MVAGFVSKQGGMSVFRGFEPRPSRQRGALASEVCEATAGDTRRFCRVKPRTASPANFGGCPRPVGRGSGRGHSGLKGRLKQPGPKAREWREELCAGLKGRFKRPYHERPLQGRAGIGPAIPGLRPGLTEAALQAGQPARWPISVFLATERGQLPHPLTTKTRKQITKDTIVMIITASFKIIGKKEEVR